MNCSENGNIIRTLYKGDYFGEKSILMELPRSMDVISKSYCICYSISVENLKNILGNEFQNILLLNFIKAAVAKSKYLSNISNSLIEKLFHLFELKNYEKNRILFDKGYLKNSKLTIVIEGNIIKVNNLKII